MGLEGINNDRWVTKIMIQKAQKHVYRPFSICKGKSFWLDRSFEAGQVRCNPKQAAAWQKVEITFILAKQKDIRCRGKECEISQWQSHSYLNAALDYLPARLEI